MTSEEKDLTDKADPVSEPSVVPAVEEQKPVSKPAVIASKGPTFSRDSFLCSKRYLMKRELVVMLMKPDERISVSEMDKRIEKYMKKPLKGGSK